MCSGWFESHSGAITAGATGMMAIFTGLLWYSTKGLWKETKESSAIAKQAADTSRKSVEIAERSLTVLEGPFLYPAIESDSIKYFCDAVMCDGDLDHAYASFRIRNMGRTHAFPHNLSATLFCGSPDEPHPDPHAGLFSEPVIESGCASGLSVTRNLAAIDKEDCKALEAGGRRIFLQGSITYFDMFGNHYEQKYCLAWDYRADSFIAWGPTRNIRKRLSSA